VAWPFGVGRLAKPAGDRCRDLALRVHTSTHMPSLRASVALILTLFALGACAGTSAEDASNAEPEVAAADRNWTKNPAVIEVDRAEEIYAISDIHGGYVEAGRLLTAAGLINGFSTDPAKADKAKWANKPGAHLVVVGDLIDKGADSIAVIDLLRAIQDSAPAGRVIVTLGNHEAEFLGDPLNSKALASTPDGEGISRQLRERGLNPADVADGKDREGRGRWLRGLPFAVRIKKWFFAHAGDTGGRSIPQLEADIQSIVKAKGFDDKEIVGKRGILGSEEWYGKTFDTARANGAALGVKHIVFGHDPGALKARGEIFAVDGGRLIKINVDMALPSENNGNLAGELLHAFIVPDGDDRADVVEASGRSRTLF
jgi:hypothetical protein